MMDDSALNRADSPLTRPRPWASLHYRDFRLLWIGHPFSQTGQWMRNTTNAFQVYHLTGSTALLGLTFLFQGTATLTVGLFGGTLADILPRRTVVRVTLSCQLALACLLAVLTLSGNIRVWHIYVITFMSSTLSATENPARASLVRDLVPRELILNATALQASVGQASSLLGPLLGGGLIDFIGAGWAYVLNAILIVPAIIAMTLMRARENPNRRPVKLNVGTLFEGLRFVISTRVLLFLLLLDMVTMLFGYYPSMMPVFARDVVHVDALGLGALLAAAPLGSLIGAVVILWMGTIERKGLFVVATTALHGVVLIMFAWSHWFILSLVLVGVLGLLDSVSVSVRRTGFQLVAREENLGRVMALISIFANISNNFGGTYLGFVSSFIGPQYALALGGFIGLSFALAVGFFVPRVRDFRP